MATKFYRNLFTGKLEQREYDPDDTFRRAERVKTKAKWPITPDAMGIDDEDIPRTEARLAQRGIPTKYNADGNPIIESPSHYRKVCKELGFYMRNASYGDPQPYNR